METIELYPTHTCFDDAAEFITLLADKNPHLVRQGILLLVHGIIELPKEQKLAHAWVELDGKVIFKGILMGKESYFSTGKDEFYREVKILDIVRYTVKEMMANALKFGNHGPWEPKFRMYTGVTTQERTIEGIE